METSERIKTVKIFKNGDLLKEFKCKRAEFWPRGVRFDGVPSKVGNKELIVEHRGDIYYNVDYSDRRAIVNFLNEPIEGMLYAIVTW